MLPCMTKAVRVTSDTITVDTAGRTVEAVPAYVSETVVQNAVGVWTLPEPVIEDDTGVPVRVVESLTATDSAGRPVDSVILSGIGA